MSEGTPGVGGGSEQGMSGTVEQNAGDGQKTWDEVLAEARARREGETEDEAEEGGDPLGGVAQQLVTDIADVQAEQTAAALAAEAEQRRLEMEAKALELDRIPPEVGALTRRQSARARGRGRGR